MPRKTKPREFWYSPIGCSRSDRRAPYLVAPESPQRALTQRTGAGGGPFLRHAGPNVSLRTQEEARVESRKRGAVAVFCKSYQDAYMAWEAQDIARRVRRALDAGWQAPPLDGNATQGRIGALLKNPQHAATFLEPAWLQALSVEVCEFLFQYGRRAALESIPAGGAR